MLVHQMCKPLDTAVIIEEALWVGKENPYLKYALSQVKVNRCPFNLLKSESLVSLRDGAILGFSIDCCQWQIGHLAVRVITSALVSGNSYWVHSLYLCHLATLS